MSKTLRVILGAGQTQISGWISTQKTQLSLLDSSTFENMFSKENTVDAFLAEDVFEHLTYEGLSCGMQFTSIS